MPSLVGPWISAGDTTVVDSSKKHELGSRAFDADGNEYIYLTGVASTLAGSWVTFDELHITALAVSDAKGRVAIAMAAIVASSYGWYLIYGKHTAAYVTTGISDNVQLYLTATAGAVHSTDVAGDFIVGAIGRSEVTTFGVSAGLTVELSYPFVHDAAID